MMRYSRGSSPAGCRWNRPGSSLRLARSPVAPNSTMTWLSGRGPVFRLALGRRVLSLVLMSVGLLLHVAAESGPHGRQDLVGELALAAGLEPLVQRGRDDPRRNAAVDRPLSGPA